MDCVAVSSMIKNRGGSILDGCVSTKLHAVVDTKGRPLHLTLTAGQRHEMMMADELLTQAQGHAVIADAGYDSNRFRAAVRSKGMKAVIGSKPERPRKLPKLRDLYAKRYLVERFFHELKRFRAIATRYEKTA